ncbi:Olfactory receptor 10G4 Olfactory receptor OR11-278 [Channa argus]|uniref:Olfactory receptor 10G4 Olfactory receptor OR11-278 n=1 Tax=Channa argus TaxID=215402 RepID=A0A6G1PSC3_CHAAH|nr:Olfactory receptor 10G4 Olfactory receptor OR11-278 [Channa argus]KAF3693185.1 Olfactory receptor 10G4 Olfactory receptor OR11-278 [Channa argus]
MSSYNTSLKVTEFIISGLDTNERPLVFGAVILLIFVVSILANITNIFVIIYDKDLHKPMYLLICNLAVVDIIYTSSSSPTMIRVLIAGVKTIPYASCLIQMFAFHLGEVMEMLVLTVMAFDRLLAVGRPFQYNSYLTNKHTFFVTFILWIVGCGFVAVLPAIVIPLPHCSTVLKYAFCNFPSIIRTTCIDPNYYFNIVAIIMFFLLFFTFIFICLSYVGIIWFMKLSSSDKQKMGSTCFSHLISVTCYYCPVFIVTILTRIGVVLTLEARNGLAIGYILGPSLLNPFVYCLRTKEIKNRIISLFKNVMAS